MFTKHFPFELKTHGSNKQQQQQKKGYSETLHTKKKKSNHKVLP